MRTFYRSISLFLIVVFLFVFTACSFEDVDDTAINIAVPSETSMVEETSTPEETPSPTPEVEEIPSSLELHFIDVGQGDAILVRCDGHNMMIDGGLPAQSSKIYSYLGKLDIDHLDYIVASHGHADHVGGLSAALNRVTVDTALSSISDFDGEQFQDFKRYLEKQNVVITVPTVGSVFSLGGASFEVLGPTRASSNENNMSLVLRLTYGSFHALFAGDAEYDEEQDIMNTGKDLQSNVMKVGHHGSDSASGYQWIYKIHPETAVISCGRSNIYGHPEENTLSRYRDSGAKVLRTDLQGDIIVSVKPDGTYTSEVEKGQGVDTLVPGTVRTTPTPTQREPNIISEGTTYVYSARSDVFHYPSCPSVQDMNPDNIVEKTCSREEMISKYKKRPCKRCNP